MRRWERRLDCRYDFERPLRYSYNLNGDASQGFGHTVEAGGGGVLFHAHCPPPDGVTLELEIAWPFLVQGVCSVVLVIQGTVVRTDVRGTAFSIQQFRFQTSESRAYDSSIDSGAICSLIG